MPIPESRNTNTSKQGMNVHKGWAFPWGIYSEIHSPVTAPEIICVMALTLQPIRGCPQHSGETGTRLSSAIHRRLLSRFFLREGGRLYTGYRDAAPESYQVRPKSLETFKPSYASSKVKNENDATRNRISKRHISEAKTQ